MKEAEKTGFEPVTEEKPVAVFYFYKGSPPDKRFLLSYLPPTGWSL